MKRKKQEYNDFRKMMIQIVKIKKVNIFQCKYLGKKCTKKKKGKSMQYPNW